MFRRLFLSITLLFFTLPLFAEDMSGSVDVVSTNSLNQNTSFLSTGDTIKKLEARRIELNSTINLEQNRVLDEVKKRDVIQNTLSDIDNLLKEWSQLNIQKIELSLSPHPENVKNDLEKVTKDLETKQASLANRIIVLSQALDAGPFSTSTPFIDLQRELPALRKLARKNIDDSAMVIAVAEKKHNDFIESKKKELEAVNVELERLRQVRNIQFSRTAQQIGWYLFVFVFLYIFKIASRSLMRRVSKDFSKSHKEALSLAHRWIFNILFVWAFLVIFAAEFVSLLPFVAIIGTAIGLALRDAIYSFIGWFAVGSESGYQEGDFIEFEGTQGRVYKITPVITNIEEYGNQWFTGKIISFPNKTIFEKNIKNWSRGSDFSLMSLEFLLTHTSNIEKAKEMLMKVVYQKDISLYYQFRREIATFKNTFGYSDDDLKPQIHVMVEPRGIMLRIRVLVHVKNKLTEQARIMESFTELVQKQSDIAFRQV